MLSLIGRFHDRTEGKANSLDPATLRATILSGAWDLPQGKVTFDPSGQGLSQQILVVGKGDDVVAAGK